MKNTRIAAADDEELTIRIRNKEFVKSLKADIRNALLAAGQHITEGELITIDQSVDRVVFATIWAMAGNKSEEEWHNDIELPLKCLRDFEIDLTLLRQVISTECQEEIMMLKRSFYE